MGTAITPEMSKAIETGTTKGEAVAADKAAAAAADAVKAQAAAEQSNDDGGLQDFFDGKLEIPVDKARLKDPDNDTFRGGKPLRDLIQHAHPAIREQLYNIQKHHTQKSQELAAANKRAEESEQRYRELEKTLLGDRQLIVKQHQQAVQQLTDMPPVDDLWSEEGLSRLAERKALEALKASYDPIAAEFQKEEKRVAEESRQRSITDFVNSRPESKLPQAESVAFWTEVAKLVEADPTANYQAAYWTVRGKRLEEAERQEALERDSSRRERLASVTVGSRAGAHALPDLRGLSAVEKYAALNEYKQRTGKLPDRKSR